MLRHTELHSWHVEQGGRMVPFAGFEMPVQYRTGIIGEHLATRRGAGLFDVSHMGRFEISGKGAESFLQGTLTNNARALEAGHAQYTFLANDEGGAVDDAYLYRLDTDRFLLVVNADNRAKDWDWLSEHISANCALADRSEELCMLALQGPGAERIAESVFGPESLPENKRNRLASVRFEGREMTLSRTGYTGESICFELFPPRDLTLALWTRLVELEAVPVGLGARNSLRLEAGLPLYGNELGLDREGRDIPIFANSLARFAVRTSGDESYLGSEALVRQREQYVRIRRGELSGPEADMLPQLVQPIAAFGSRRPLRTGYTLHHEGEAVGYVTSGTTVPYSAFNGTGVDAAPSDTHELRPHRPRADGQPPALPQRPPGRARGQRRTRPKLRGGGRGAQRMAGGALHAPLPRLRGALLPISPGAGYRPVTGGASRCPSTRKPSMASRRVHQPHSLGTVHLGVRRHALRP